MKDWLDEEMEREGLSSKRSEAARLREERAAFCDSPDRLHFSFPTIDANELKLTHRASAESALLRQEHHQNCEAEKLKDEHAAQHSRLNKELAAMRNGKSSNPPPALIVAAVICLIFVLSAIRTVLEILA